MSRAATTALVLALVPLLGTAQTAAVTPAHYIVCEIDRDDAITVRFAEEVMLAGELRSDPPEVISMRDMRMRDEPNRVDVRLRDRTGVVVFRTTVDVDWYQRAESARGTDGTGEIHGRWTRRDTTAFVVRVPIQSAETLELTPRRMARTTRIPISDIARDAGSRFRIAPASIAADGSPANRLDVLIMGDGYTSAQQSQFQSDASTLSAAFFGIVPYSTYSNYVNVTTHFVASSQSGADHPSCSDPGKVFDPLEGTFVNTAFDAMYCSFNTQRNVTISDAKVLAAAAAAPNWDKIIVIVNDTMYGGSGGPISTVSRNALAPGIAQHEFGHSFSALADEYTTAFPGYPSCSDISGGAPCESNVTNVTTRASIKWNPWISGATPVPTTPQASYPTVPGLFEGARYLTSGFYRPRNNCLMNNLGQPFCEVCAQTYILRLYNGWGGAPASGIDMIEPGTESPAPGAVSGAIGEAQTFTATILQPSGGPTATKQWFVDSALQGGATSNSFNYTPASGGAHTVELRVTDATTLVNATMAGTALQTNRIWTVNVSSIVAPANFVATAGTSSVALSWSAVAGATSYEIARSTGGGFTHINTVSALVYNDSAVSSNTAYVYKVRAVGGAYSTPDLATVFTATDDPATTSILVKAVHLTQLRSLINAARTATGLGAATYTFTPTVGGIVRAADVQEMRTALNTARTTIGMTAFSFTDPTLTAQTSLVRAIHVNELRSSIR